MKRFEIKLKRRARRKIRVRKRIFGSAEKPRLTVFRSNRNITAQLIDDVNGRTLAQASSQNKDVRKTVKDGGNVAAAAHIGELLAQRAVVQGIRRVEFDRNGYRYHGRIKTLADAAREGGLKF